MPPRLNKRQLRELEELQALDAGSHNDGEQFDDDDAEDDDEEGQTGHTLATGFAALVSAAGEDAASEDEDVVQSSKSKKKKKKKKASGVSTPAAPVSDAPETSSLQPGPSAITKKERKALKKQKAKAAAKDDEDDLDKALAALSLKYPELRKSAQSASAAKSSPALVALLQVSLAHLDSEAEMRRFFGAKVISASKASASSSSSPAARRQAAAMKSSLTRPQPTWWPAAYRQGLSARLLTDEELEDRRQRHGWGDDILGERIWTVEYSRKYRGMTKTFMQMVMTGDPEGLFQLLRSFPYHADTLLQLSEVYFHREEHSTAADFIDRALFTYERAFVGSFNFTSGLNRLDFDHVENRPFFLAVHRQVSDLQRRGCIRTAFEFARLLYSLDPSTDPHGALLHLDYLSLKAGMHEWLLDLWDTQCHLTDNEWKGRMHVRALPGWAYSRALALFMREEGRHDREHEESSKALVEAVHAFPSVVSLLADKADISLSTDIRSHPAFRIATDVTMLSSETEAILHLLSHLYAQRSFSLWKLKSRSFWFASTLNHVAKTLPSTSLSPPMAPTSPSPLLLRTLFSTPALTSSVYRHVIVLEAAMRGGRLFGFLPPAVTTGRQLACDPLPPSTRINEYNSDFFQGAEDITSVRPNGRNAQRLLERLIPDPVFRRQLQDFFEANQNFAERFPGGFVEFAQLAGQLPEDMLEDLMIEVAAGGGRAMPGQMPGEGIFDEDIPRNEVPRRVEVNPEPLHADPDSEDEEDSEEEHEDEDVAPLPVRILRNVLNRFWGGNPHDLDQSSDEEDALPRDEQGVD